MLNTVLIIQARMGSSRLPGKVLLPLSGKPMLEWVLLRGSAAKKINSIVVATTTAPADNAIATWCDAHEINCFRGSEFDVLDRYYQCAKRYDADRIVRITADCPLIDPGVMDAVISMYEHETADFGTNRLPPPWQRTWPIGLDTEVVSIALLEKAWFDAKETYQREHVMPFFYTESGRFKVAVHECSSDCGTQRWTVDTPEDYQLLQKLFSLIKNPLTCTWEEIMQIIQHNPELSQINASTHAKNVDVVDERAGTNK